MLATEAQKNKKDFNKFTERIFNLSEQCGQWYSISVLATEVK